jgi:hypothetical protein
LVRTGIGRHGERHGETAQDRGLRRQKIARARRLIARHADGLQPLRHPVEHRAGIFLQVGRDARRHQLGLILIGFDVEISAGHHRDRGGNRARGAGDQHRLLIGGGRGDAEHQAEDRNRAVLHAEHDFAGGGLQRRFQPSPQRCFAHATAFQEMSCQEINFQDVSRTTFTPP